MKLSFNYGLIFNRINRLMQTDCRSAVPASAVIDIETLEVWKNQRECAEELGWMLRKYRAVNELENVR